MRKKKEVITISNKHPTIYKWNHDSIKHYLSAEHPRKNVRVEGLKIHNKKTTLYFYLIEAAGRRTFLNSQADLTKPIRRLQEGAWTSTGMTESEWLESEFRKELDDKDIKELQKIAEDPKHPLDPIVDTIIDGKVRIIEKEEQPESLEDYPENIQHEAEKIVRAAERGELDLLEWFLDLLDQVHAGDRLEKALALLSVGTLFTENADPVHQAIRGRRGSGKTHMILSVAKVIPERYIHIIRSSSPLYLFYASQETEEPSARLKLREDHNICIFDDVPMNPKTIDLLKFLTDNELETKTHKTVIEQKAVELKIPGENLTFITRAQPIPDEELNDRLLYNNPKESPEHKKRQLEFITKKKQALSNEDIEHELQVAQAVFEHLIREPIKILNPHLRLIEAKNPEDTEPRKLERLIDLVLAVTFYRQFQRPPIYNHNIILGTKEDLHTAIKIIKNIDLLQHYQIDKSQERLLRNLPVYDENKLQEWRDWYKEDQDEFLSDKKFPTYRNLAERLGHARNTVKNWVRGLPGMTQPTLIDQGLVQTHPIDPYDKNSATILFLTEKGHELIKTVEEKKALLGFKLKKRTWTDKEKEEIIENALRAAGLEKTKAQELIKIAKEKPEWNKTEDDETFYQLLKSVESERAQILPEEEEKEDVEIKEPEAEHLQNNHTPPNPQEETKEEKGTEERTEKEKKEGEEETGKEEEKEETEEEREPEASNEQTNTNPQEEKEPEKEEEEEEEEPPKIEVPEKIKRLQKLTYSQRQVYTFIRDYNLRKRSVGAYPGCHPDTIRQELGLGGGELERTLVSLELQSLIVRESGYLLIKELRE